MKYLIIKNNILPIYNLIDKSNFFQGTFYEL